MTTRCLFQTLESIGTKLEQSALRYYGDTRRPQKRKKRCTRSIQHCGKSSLAPKALKKFLTIFILAYGHIFISLSHDASKSFCPLDHTLNKSQNPYCISRVHASLFKGITPMKLTLFSLLPFIPYSFLLPLINDTG